MRLLNSTKYFLLCTFLIGTGGCSSLREVTMPDEKNLLSGAGSIIVGDNKKAKEFEQINIDDIVTKYGLGNVIAISQVPIGAQSPFIQRRNELQAELIAVSNQRCAAYIRVLLSSKAQAKMSWGGLAALLSGAASVTTPASTAKALAAGSTVSSTLFALYDEAYFNSLTVNVVASGITRYREEVAAQIKANLGKNLVEYPVNQAISDALMYHSGCNMVSGLESAAKAISSLGKNEKIVAPDL